MNATNNVNPSNPWGTNQQYYACLAILFQASPGNTGKTFIGDRVNFNRSSGTGLLAVLGIPTNNIVPSAGATIPNAPAALNAVDYWVDADVGGEAVTVSILVG